MRPAEYRSHLVDLLKRTTAVQGAKALESGPYPYALTATVGAVERCWQVMGQLADGAAHEAVTAPVEGHPPAWTDAPVSASPDAWLAGVIGRSEPVDVERLDVWSARKEPGPVGVTVYFHNGERVYLRLF